MFRPQYPVLKVRRRRSPDAQGDTLHRRVPSVKGFSRKFSRAPRGGPRGAPAPPRAGPPPRKRDWHYTPPAPPPGAGGGGLHGIPTNGGGAARAGAPGLRGGGWPAGCGGASLAGGRAGAAGGALRLRGEGVGAAGGAAARSRGVLAGRDDATLAANPQHHGVRSAAAAGTSTVNDAANVR